MLPVDITAMVAAAALIFGAGGATVLARRPKPATPPAPRMPDAETTAEQPKDEADESERSTLN